MENVRRKSMNRIVDGCSSSQHIKGEAADIISPNLSITISSRHKLISTSVEEINNVILNSKNHVLSMNKKTFVK